MTVMITPVWSHQQHFAKKLEGACKAWLTPVTGWLFRHTNKGLRIEQLQTG